MFRVEGGGFGLRLRHSFFLTTGQFLLCNAPSERGKFIALELGSNGMRTQGTDCERKLFARGLCIHCNLTFDMRGGRQQAKPDVGRPLDGRVSRHSNVQLFLGIAFTDHFQCVRA